MSTASSLDSFDNGPTPAIAIQLARIPEVDLVAGLGARRHAAILRVQPRPAQRWLPLSIAILATFILVSVALGAR